MDDGSMLRVPLEAIDNRSPPHHVPAAGQKSSDDNIFQVFPRVYPVHLAPTPTMPSAPQPLMREMLDHRSVSEESPAINFKIFEDSCDLAAEKLVEADAHLLHDLEAGKSPSKADVGGTRTSLTSDSESPVTEFSPFNYSADSADSLIDESMETYQHTQTQTIQQLRRQNSRLRALLRPCQNVKRHAARGNPPLQRGVDMGPPLCSESEHGSASAISAAFSEDAAEAPADGHKAADAEGSHRGQERGRRGVPPQPLDGPLPGHARAPPWAKLHKANHFPLLLKVRST